MLDVAWDGKCFLPTGLASGGSKNYNGRYEKSELLHIVLHAY